DSGGTGAESAAPSPAGAAKSKLDTLSKDDLIKFAKKQMAAMQKMKSRCAGGYKYEEPARGSGIAKMLELSGLSQGDSSHGDGEETEASKLRAALEDLQAQNTMLHDELTLLSNVKSELEAELERAKEEFQTEREELEFKIDELQMTRESAPSEPVVTLDPDQQEVQGESKEPAVNTEEQQKLRDQCETLTRERDSALAECQHMRDILQSVEIELGEKTKDFVLQYQAMREQGTNTVRELQDKIEQLSQERDGLLVKVKDVTEEKNTLMENTKEQKLKSEGSPDLKEMVNTLTKERDKIQSLLQMREEEMQKLNDERAKEFERLLEEKEKEALLLREEKEKELKGLKKEMEDEVQDLKEEREKIEESLKEEVGRRQETVSALELTIKELSTEKADLHQKLEEASSGLAKAQEERELLGSRILVRALQLLLPSAFLEKENKEKDEKMNKIKAVAVKAKKELDISKKEVATLKEEVESLKAEREKMNSSMKDIIHGAEGYKNLQIDYDRQTEQLDKERERVEAAERQIAELTKRLSSAVTQYETLSSEKEDLQAGMETMRSTVRQLETQNQELQRQSANLDKDLLAERAMKEQKIKDLSSAMKEVEELTAQLRKQQQQSQQTAQELEQLRKEAQQNSLLDMEMADYERLVKELNSKLSEKDERAEELKTQINTLTQKEDTLKQEIEALKSQLDQGEEKTSKMKQLLVKTKKDLADAKKQESSLMVLQASLKGELEANQQQLETSKIDVCELTAERHRLQEQLRSVLEQQQRTSSSLQQRINSLQQERDTAKAELVATTGEFESYKVRVHNVLKQQKSKTTAQSEGDSGKLEREQLSSQVEQLRSKLAETQQSLQSSAAELQQLQTEHDTLLERHNKILQETISKEAELRERLLSVQSENVALRSDLSQTQVDLSSQVEAQRQTYREQLRKLQDDHRATVETLQGQLTRVEEQLFNLQSQNTQASRKPLGSDPQRRSTDQNQAGLGQVALSDLQSMAREEGEGMETTETESPSPALLPSLEQLLTSPDPKQEPFVWTVEPTKEELSQKLTTATRSMEHMNSLLHETEATNAVLMEQITLLKSEVRRLERNQEREKSVANLEYLKNVLLQFIFLRSGSERQALLPVIHTMLQLSPEEKSKLAAIAQGEEEGAGSRGSGWTSYLHSWSGIR
uniref:GRIP and coiled-coil domain containing 2 n=1 Tax=Lates calcarifer TaxID=8187 RepID=A0A4W6FH78_LATCA